jgi:hypothetical protein
VRLADALMQARVDVGLSHALDNGLAVRLDKVRDSVFGFLPDPAMRVGDGILVHREIRALSTVAHLARWPLVMAG